MDFFEENRKKAAPLYERMRPSKIENFVGQEHIVGKNSLLRRAIEADSLGSCIFYGPAGTGKTTLANIISKTTNSRFVKLNAVSSGYWLNDRKSAFCNDSSYCKQMPNF